MHLFVPVVVVNRGMNFQFFSPAPAQRYNDSTVISSRPSKVSPQLFKQILMIGGFDRYFQIVRCFRDEDLRADRQPEFTQVDIEMAFPQREVLFDMVERLMEKLFALVGVRVERPFAHLTYETAMEPLRLR